MKRLSPRETTIIENSMSSYLHHGSIRLGQAARAVLQSCSPSSLIGFSARLAASGAVSSHNANSTQWFGNGRGI